MKKNILFALSLLFPFMISSQEVIHYWHFNDADDDSLYSVQADTTLLGTAPFITYREAFANISMLSRMDDVSGSSINARFGEPDGRGIRPRNPSDSMELLIELPSIGYENLILSYAARRTNNGMLQQVIYTTTDGSTFTPYGDTIDMTTDYELVQIDFSLLPAANDNPDFAVKILFFGQNTGTDGNNRFDNVVLQGTPVQSTGPETVHYWHFNTADDDSLYSVNADFTLSTSSPSITYREAFAGLSVLSRMDDVSGSSINARFGEPSGRGIRPRNPSDSMELFIELPSQGYEDLKLSYATERSGSGMLQQVIYTTTDGTLFTVFGDTVNVNTDYELVEFDFTSLTAANDNPDFAVKIMFFGQNTGSGGNNRFDNLTFEGTPVPADTPVIDVTISPKEATLDIAQTLTFTAQVLPANATDQSVSWVSTDATVASVDSNGNVEALSAGFTHIIVTTNDGNFSDTAHVFVQPDVEYDNLIYYWHFNTLDAPDDVTSIEADYSAVPNSNPIMTYEGTGNRDMDDYDPGSDINLHLGEPAGLAARVRNPSEDRALVFNLNTTESDNLRFEYVVKRSNNGMLKNIVEYSTDGGNTYTSAELFINEFDITTDYELITVNFEHIAAVNNNPDFMIKITWEGNTTGDQGNNRYDNITLKGNYYGEDVSTNDVLNEENHISVFPNPSNGIFMVRTDNASAIDRITVLDLQGKVLLQRQNQSEFEMDLSAHAKGIYLIRTESKERTTVQKIILK